jgi:hypothetical protein
MCKNELNLARSMGVIIIGRLNEAPVSNINIMWGDDKSEVCEHENAVYSHGKNAVGDGIDDHEYGD